MQTLKIDLLLEEDLIKFDQVKEKCLPDETVLDITQY